jgi:hypothetical protein
MRKPMIRHIPVMSVVAETIADPAMTAGGNKTPLTRVKTVAVVETAVLGRTVGQAHDNR